MLRAIGLHLKEVTNKINGISKYTTLAKKWPSGVERMPLNSVVVIKS
jgi:hypothetical protein